MLLLFVTINIGVRMCIIAALKFDKDRKLPSETEERV